LLVVYPKSKFIICIIAIISKSTIDPIFKKRKRGNFKFCISFNYNATCFCIFWNYWFFVITAFSCPVAELNHTSVFLSIDKDATHFMKFIKLKRWGEMLLFYKSAKS